ncbi:hypothetical protein [Candidatus Enterococcus murrayae]|uniref:DUF1648 domain-containing protein n=1 Tax=Candidatus Enterococcus murrayae TaxID=2815321 RepID=A0ABS3HJ89_9ENTE|nr:hypothetical protein [Enterococcus sp. MJM16]MBO0453523.1 hypothetical protein [Enterococcus sp. MJM16]
MEKHIKKAKTWNLVLIVLGLLSLVSNLIGLPKSLNPKMSSYEMMGPLAQQMFDYMNNPLTKIISVLSLVISIALLVFYFRANKKLADDIVPIKMPYYVNVGWNLFSLAIGLIMQPKMEFEGINLSLATTIIALIVQLIFLIPAILVIVHLFKAEPEE